MSDADYLRRAERALMNAPFEADGWHRAIAMVTEATGSSGANLVALGGPLLMPLNMFVGRDSDVAAACFERPELWGPCNWRVQSAGAPGTIQYERHYALTRAAGGTADYDDAVSDLDMQYGCQTPLISDSRSFLGLALFRGRREGPCTEATLKTFQYLIRHLQRSVRVQLALDGEAAELMLGGDLTAMHCATVLLDRYGNLCALTPAAERLLEDGGPARLEGLALRLRDRAEDRLFHQSMARLLAAADDHRGPLLHEMRAGRCPDWPWGQYRMFIVRLPRRPHGLGFEAQLAISFRPVAGNGIGKC